MTKQRQNYPIYIGLLGCGTVGSGVVRVLEENRSIIEKRLGFPVLIKKIGVKHIHKPRPGHINKNLLTHDGKSIVRNPDIHIVVETIGGVGDAQSLALSALHHKKHFVTSNKELIAKHGHDIFLDAGKHGLMVRYEGSVGGGIPILRAIQSSLTGDKVTEITGIVNGTTNFILTRMAEEKQDFQEALAEAQKKGYAEADPRDDVEGFDAAYKITILAMLAFSARVNVKKVFREGITKISQTDIEYARELGYIIKLLAIAKDHPEGVEVRVHPALLPVHHPLAKVEGIYNAIFVRSRASGDLMFYGQGAGSLPTATAVVADILEIAKKIHSHASHERYAALGERKTKSMGDVQTEYYVRMQVTDRPGVLGRISGVFGREKVSLASIVQKKSQDKVAEIVWITHTVKERNLQRALGKISKLEVVKDISCMLRVEE